MNKLVLAIAMTFLVGCASGGGQIDVNYKAQLDSIERQKNAQFQAQMMNSQSQSAMASVCEKDVNPGLCLTALSLTHTIASMNASNQQIVAPTFKKTYHPAWGIAANVLDKTLGLGIPAYLQYKNNQTTSEMWTGIIGSVSDRGPTYAVNGDMSLGDMTSVGGNFGDTDQSVNVGGNLGNTDNSISAGGDYIVGSDNVTGEGNTIGDGNTNVGGDQFNGNDQFNGDANNNTGRIYSEGPFTYGEDSDTCDPMLELC